MPTPTLVEKKALELSKSDLDLVSARYLNINNSPNLNSGHRDNIIESLPDFKVESVGQCEKSNFTKTNKFRYRLKYREIPIYGSSVIVELDDNGKDLYLASASVDQIASAIVDQEVDQKEAVNLLRKEFPENKPRIKKEHLPSYIKNYYEKQHKYISLDDYNLNPSLYYFFLRKNCSSDINGHWKLAYVTEISVDNKKVHQEEGKYSENKIETVSPELFDYVIDAHTGEILVKLSNIKTFS